MKNVIGIDIGGTKISGVLFNGKVLKDLEIATPKNLFEFERNVCKLVDFLSAGTKISGIGIGSAGYANPISGVVRLSGNLKFRAKVDFKKLLHKKYNVTVKVDNDSSSFTRAEMLAGQGKQFKNFLGLILGTGFGGGIVINGRLYRGQQNSGGEFGHIVLDKGFLEKEYFHGARDKNDYVALSKILGRAFASLANIFAPEAIILGGGVSLNAHKKFLPGARKEMVKFLFNPNLEMKILVSKLKNAGAIGAALLFK